MWKNFGFEVRTEDNGKKAGVCMIAAGLVTPHTI
jgi:hypothetical protein